MIIEKLDGTRYNLGDLDIRTIDFIPEAPSIINKVEEVDGGGHIVVDSRHDIRRLSCILRFVGRDMSDYFMLMREVFALFNGLTEFYIINPYEQGMRWKVRTEGSYTPDRKLFSGDFTISFICPSGVSESVGTSIDLQNHKEWDVDLWQWGMGLDWDKEYRYEYSSNSFTIDNIGRVLIDPCKHELEITIKATASSYLEIKNNTTSDIYRYNGALTSNDILVLKGVQTFKNGLSAFRNTNKKLLTLGIGSNQFTVTGGTIASISFKFRFLYM